MSYLESPRDKKAFFEHIGSMFHSHIVNQKIFQCPHDNRIYLTTFDCGVEDSETWNVCEYCSTKPEFSRHIISKDELLKS